MSAIGQTMPAAVATRATSALRALEEAPMGDKAAVRERTVSVASRGAISRVDAFSIAISSYHAIRYQPRTAGTS